MWLTAPKGATPVNQTSATDWQMAAPLLYNIQSFISLLFGYLTENNMPTVFEFMNDC